MTTLNTLINKSILIQTSYQPTPHLETEMEIIEKLLENGNKIFWIICEGDFKVCFQNPNHLKIDCKKCFSRVSNGFDLLKSRVFNHQNLNVIKYNQFLSKSDFNINFQSKNLVFKTFNELKAFHYKTYDSGLATASSLVSYTRNHEPIIENHIDFIKNGLFTGAYLYETFQLILNQIKPDFVILFNGRFIENRPLLRVCQEKKIEYATHERGGKINSFLFQINSIPHSISTISKEMEQLWKDSNENKFEIGEKFYSNRIKRVEDAWYSFTKEQQLGRLPESFRQLEGKKVITIFNSSLDEYEGLEGFGPFFYDNDNEGIKAICESLKNDATIKLYIRIHPNLKGIDNSQNRFLNEIANQYKTVEMISADDSVDTYALIKSSEIVIVFGSTVGVEAAFSGKNVVLLGKAAYMNLNCVTIPKNHLDLMTILTDSNYVFPKINHEDTLKYGYWNESFGMNYKNYIPTSLNDGLYGGKKIELTWFQKKKFYFLAKYYRKKNKYFPSLNKIKS